MAIATDVTEGIVDRFRTLPMARSAYLFGHLLAELAAATIALVAMPASGLVVGWRIHADLPHALDGFGVLFLFASAMLWIGTLLGLLVRSPDAVTGLAFITMFPLTFLANAFVPAAGLPDGLRTLAEWKPISAVIAAVRNAVRQPDRDARRRGVAAAAPGRRRRRLVRRAPRARGAADDPAVPGADDR
jgi:ABC-2 type transport system permease protein